LIDRRFSRQLPIQADYVGKTIDSIIIAKSESFSEREGWEGRSRLTGVIGF
jgi:pyrimidine operon attenuation protein/uracil phosphoribosyltransferase